MHPLLPSINLIKCKDSTKETNLKGPRAAKFYLLSKQCFDPRFAQAKV
jgi:hypothetical protein